MTGRPLISTLALALVALGFAAASRGADEGAYIGANKCRMCHMPQYKAWSGTRHAHAMAALAGESEAQKAMAAALQIEILGSAKQTDACVACHVTGFRKPGGYPQPDEAKNAALAQVGCEACHGPGSRHAAAAADARKRTILGHPTAEVCNGCHTDAASPNFDFEALKSHVHPVVSAAEASGK
jgi:hypothetical protein